MKEFVKSLSLWQKTWSLTVCLCLLLFLVLTLYTEHLTGGLGDQQAAARWEEDGGAAQVSCFFAEEAGVDEYKLLSLENDLNNALTEAAVEPANENSRLFVDAYSGQGKITLVSEQTKAELNAVGIGGDFFFFHPLTLVSGGYFSGNDLMKDSVLVDEETAWQLFGSNDIVGMSVTIGGVPHYISGVVKRESGRMAEHAGLTSSVVYVSFETLSVYGTCGGITAYEVAAHNPVKKFLYNTVKEKMALEEDQITVVENSARFSIESMIPVILDFGVRSMQNAAIRYPYWENMARGYEDIRAVLLLLQFLLLLIPTVILLVFLMIRWKNRKYKLKDLVEIAGDKKDRFLERQRAKKREKGEGEE